MSINYTSGTTARPKGVRLTHRSVWLQAAVLGWHAAISDRDVYLHTLPLFHVNGWGASYALTAVGARQVVMRKVDGEEVLRRVKAHGVTLLCGAPSVVSIVLDAAAERQKKRCGGQQQQQQSPPVSDRRGGGPRVRMIVAGAPPPSSLIAKLETVLGWEFCQLYGLTETSPMLTFNRRRQEWDGLPPGRRAKLLALAGAPALGVRLAVSADGELLARSNHVFDGYHNQPEETARAIAGGWFHSGDGGRVVEVTEGGSDAVAASAEASGRASSCEAAAGRPAGGSAAWPSTTGGCAYVEVTDRKKDVIITGGAW